ncbi:MULTISPECIES: cob(I)yrinic acid a,c-diamide adenosyltransferase [Roseivirga]|uniref:Corrinoid adenosyltransferase n=1 Tax=Roseivirga spongicola TaxID=333140 RepID=A0A150XAH0_9BACT|nr:MULTISPECIES: cob(I)yrinic acid a,c-diamide adenosyltransferase [Roseivirga]PWL29321.1 MAG: cob(I)yrinic acid a,c-diamide adenosyltransferase [Roseivirga sp. XM-24bin3]KYG75674.1 cob(I)yrinic acid a c-diamide adenosyltransferase [Roseivirga spongicola]MBO6662441.1 cob(I)yrinic acid a,c-diamide adenosyltransferase [Roseivirga sp.]MBO6759727.1 cob(I)yrinic acid a,c-diamide adenosyltransferase [Roseivirga sp.]MBO6909995.1 cob(I)yrinic acid a,c-diamide adenosyltransferase [Roseivirga sp.]
MKIYTKTGDSGTTSLLGGARVSKAHIRIEAYGTVDELNSYIGLLRDQEVNSSRKEILKTIQDRLFTIGADLATEPGKDKVVKPDLLESDIQVLESAMDAMDDQLPALTSFVLPGGHQSVSFSHIARCVCRRAERISIALNDQEPISPLVIQYLNRLSDYLFVLGRIMAQELQAEEVKWEPRKK